jgi:hypothetical protein
MSLETTLADIIARLRQGRFPNEQAVSQGIVLRVLQELGWDIYETGWVYKLDLFERPPPDAAETLRRYLARARVESGEALEASRKEYCSRNRRTQACAAIPEPWRNLVEKGKEDLVDMLASAVESKAHSRMGSQL